ncbi:Dehydrogenase/reductase SDR member 12, partial [Halocaridina rubra]
CNSGIGLEIAREVAKRGGVLHMVCRNFESAKKARAELITDTGNDKIHLYTLDLAKPREVADWAKEFAATHEKIHVLINNAGCMVHERKLNEDGIETNFAVNTLAMHLITTALLPVLQKNEDARVVTVSSAGMLTVRLDPNDLMHENMDPFNGTLVYSQNKRQQVVMTLWYAQRYDKVHFSVMHPGWADTPAVRSSLPLFYEQMKDNLRTAAEGADTAVWLAISKAAIKFPSGFFFQ